MLGMLLRTWWVLVLRGLFAILFGVVTVLWPDITVFVLVTIFAALFLLDGLTAIWVGFANRGREAHWWTDAGLGLVSVVLGVAILAWPDIGAAALVIVIGSWMLLFGATLAFQGWRVRDDLAGDVWVVGTGALLALAGMVFLVLPGVGAVALAWAIGLVVTVLGVLLVKIGWGLGRIDRNLRAEVIRDYQSRRRAR